MRRPRGFDFGCRVQFCIPEHYQVHEYVKQVSTSYFLRGHTVTLAAPFNSVELNIHPSRAQAEFTSLAVFLLHFPVDVLHISNLLILFHCV